MANFLELLSLSARLLRQQREIAQLREELAKLRAQNDSMREGMRRCVTCEYRIEVRERQQLTSESKLIEVPGGASLGSE